MGEVWLFMLKMASNFLSEVIWTQIWNLFLSNLRSIILSFDLPVFRSELSKINFDRIETITSNPNEMWLLRRTFFFDVLNKHAPIGNIKIKGNNLPYITAEVRQLARQRDFLRKKANKTGSKYLKQAFQQIKNKVTYKLRSLRFEYYSRKISENQGDMKGTWKSLRKAMKKEAKQSDIETIFVDNEEMTNKKFLNGLMITLFQLVRSLLRTSHNHPNLPWRISQKSTRMRINSSLKC